MTLSDLASLAIIGQGFLFIVSLFLVWYQLRENTKLVRAANTQKLVELSVPFSLQLAQDRALATLWEQAKNGLDELDVIDQGRYFNLLTWWLTLHENIYHQWKRKLIDDETFRSWTRDLEFWIERQHLATHWPRLYDFFEVSFAQHVTGMLARQPQEED